MLPLRGLALAFATVKATSHTYKQKRRRMAKRTYDHVIGNLPKMGIAPERRDIVQAVQKEILEPGPKPAPTMSLTVALKNGEEAAEALIANMRQFVPAKPNASSLAQAYSLCRTLKDRMDDWIGSMNVLIEAYQWLMLQAMDDEKMSGLRLSTGQLISKWEEPYAKVEDKDAFRDWCMADPDLKKKLALQWQTTNELCKAMLLKGEATIDEETGEVVPAPMPPGIAMMAVTRVRMGE
jgi:hypothetical protein